MSIRRFVLKVLLGGAVALLALYVGVAGAATPKLVSNGNFHAEGGSGVAVDQASGDVFTIGFFGVSETGGLRVGRGEKFDASGNALSPPSPFDEGLRYSVAVNPTNGDLYVASPLGETENSGQIEIIDPNTGAELSSFSVPAFSSELLFLKIIGDEAQIATDSEGDVYVPNPTENKVLKYDEAGVLLETFAGSGEHALNEPTGVTVAPSGDVWIADHGDNRVEEFSATGLFLSEFESEGVRALAVDGHGDVFAIVNNAAGDCGAVGPPCEHLAVYSESGVQLADVGGGYFGSHSQKTYNESMVAVDDASGWAYVTDPLKNAVWVYRPPLAPVVGQESSAEVGTSEAKLGALVQPGGIPTTYRFEYDTREYREGEGSHGVSVPYPEGSAGEGFSSRAVLGSAKSLMPGTTYHYRAVVTNGLGTVVGPDRTFTTESLAQAVCPNEQARSGFSALLPECRAYELVTPLGNSSAQPDTKTERGPEEGTYREGESINPGGFSKNIASSNGDRFAYEGAEAMPGSQSPGLEFIATRGPNGWSTEDAIPLRPYTNNRCVFPVSEQTEVLKYSPELSRAVLVDNVDNTGRAGLFFEGCRTDRVEVVSGEPFEENLLMHDNEDGSYQLVNLTPAGVAAEPAKFVAASADLKLVVFTDRAKLTPGAVGGATNLYEWSEGVVRLLRLELPSGAPVAGSVASISADGSDLLFQANGNLYARVNVERTVQLDEAQGGSGPGGGGEPAADEGAPFGYKYSPEGISADGSLVFFYDDATAGLTSDTVSGSGRNLYSYDVSTGHLTDLTPVGGAEAVFYGTGEEGSYVYFSSDGVQAGSRTNQFGETAQSGQANLYVEHDGTTTFLMNAALMSAETHNAVNAMSQNGAYFAFNSNSSLTGYDNNGNPEIYLYSAAANRFECASCAPSGAATPIGSTLADFPHMVSDNGQVFFETGTALLPRDTNGTSDVYEFSFTGGLSLISTGTSPDRLILLDASVSGNDVFFLTTQSLVPQDGSQEANKIYDARVDGGFPETALPPACTTADACRSASTPQPTIYGAPSSQTFSGAGNLAPPTEVKAKKKAKEKAIKCKKGFVKKKNECVKAKKSKQAKKSDRKERR